MNSRYRGSINLLRTRPLNFDPGLPDNSALWRFRGVPALSHNSQRLPDPARCCPSLHARVSHPLTWPHSQPRGSPLARAQAPLLLAQPGPLLSLEGLKSPGCLGSYIHPSQRLHTLGETECSLGSQPQLTLNTFSVFGFIRWSSLRCVFKTSTVAFKKTIKSLCSISRIKSSVSILK